MEKNKNAVIINVMGFILALFFTVQAHAKDIDIPPTQFRLFAGLQTIDPMQVNTVTEAGGLNKFKNIGVYGGEATYALFRPVSLGLRVIAKYQKELEKASPSANPQNPYYSSIQQTEGLLLVRVDLISSKVLKLDVFSGVGSAETSMDIRTSSGDGNYHNSMSGLTSAAGASLGVGYSNIYFMLEVGQEWNKASKLTVKGVTDSSINTIDLSGSYFLAGLIFNGMPGFIHTK